MTAERFPTDWNVWREQWRFWISQHPELVPIRKAIPGQNFLSDEIIGTYRLPTGRAVELNEVTFPNLEERDESGRLIDRTNRFVGLVFADDRSGSLAANFAELEEALQAQKEAKAS